MGTAAREKLQRVQSAPVSLKRRLRRWYYHRVARLLTLLYRAGFSVAELLGPRPRRKTTGSGYRLLITGRFESDNWITSHLQPLAASRECSCVWMVATSPVPPIPKVVPVYPSRWLRYAAGNTLARLTVFASMAVRRRPDIIGGFNLIMNGLATVVLARLVGARSMYFSCGGPIEVLGGGFLAESGPFARMEGPDPVVEQRLLQAVSACDLVIAMGTGAVRFFRDRGVNTHFHVVSGGIDAARFSADHAPRPIDVILVGRLAEIKRIDLFLAAISRVVRVVPHLRAVVVGDGPLRGTLEQTARDLELSGNVRFVGHQTDVAQWLRQSKVFVLTSRSEGLSLALMEATMCGVPAVVPDVGDLADLVTEGVNGHLVDDVSPEVIANRIVELLTDDARRSSFSTAARQAAMRYESHIVTEQWDRILAEQNGHVR